MVAIVTKKSPRDKGEPRLKAAAGFAEAGDVHDVVAELWRNETSDKWTLVDKVWFCE